MISVIFGAAINLLLDNTALNNLRTGNEKFFEKLFRDNYASLCGYAVRYIGDSDQAEEVVQDMFFNFWQKRESLDIQTSVEAYLFRSVRNACLNLLKHLKVSDKYRESNKISMQEQEKRADDIVVALELEERIETAIEELPKERKRIFKMSRHEGLKYKEIAEQLNISIKTVEVQMGKALSHLREQLAEYLVVFIVLFIHIIKIFIGIE